MNPTSLVWLSTATDAATPPPAAKEDPMTQSGRCPVMLGERRTQAGGQTANQHWWPQQINLRILHQHIPQVLPESLA